jgi:RNA-directed DNA polymerase
VISLLLANIYLHYVLDEWFEKAARPRLKGRCQLVRYADDAVMAFEDHLICAAAFVPSCSLNKTL